MWSVAGKYAPASELYRDTRVEDKRILSATINTFDFVRELHGGPLGINSGRRSQAKQEELKLEGYRAATVSPHVYGAALDVDVPDGKRDEYLVALILGAAQIMGLPRPRIGYKQYRKGYTSSFVHFDYCFLLPPETLASLPESVRLAWRVGAMW